jgi:hypothetical protein
LSGLCGFGSSQRSKGIEALYFSHKTNNVKDRQITLKRQTFGLPPTFALGATLITPPDLVKSFEVLSLAALTNGLHNPDRTSSFDDSVLRDLDYLRSPSVI